MKYADRQWLIKALVGSHNYNLNIETSDKDYKVFVLPTFNDLYKGEKVSKCSVSNDEDVAIHDIRMLVNMLYKSNVNFTEVLFSKELIINPELPLSTHNIVTEIIKNREEYAKMNLPYLWDACIGMYLQNKSKMGYADLNDKAFDSKKAMTAYRILDFLERYALFMQNNIEEPFKNAMRYGSTFYTEDKKVLLMYLRNTANFIEAKQILEDKFGKVQQYKSFYKQSEVNEKLKLELERDLKKIVYKNI